MGSQGKSSGVLRPYLELIRPPALCTAPADVLSGLAWVLWVVDSSVDSTQSMAHIWTGAHTWAFPVLSAPLDVLLCCVCVSICVYASGMITNDIFDVTVDTQERPQRPIPSQRVSIHHAWCFALVLQAIALSLAIYVSFFTLIATLITVICTYLYNATFKQTRVAPMMMGLCRLSNFWIGGSLFWDSSRLVNTGLINTGLINTGLTNTHLFVGLMISVGTALYVMTLTELSLHEVSGGVKAKIVSYRLCLFSLTPLLWLSLGWLQWGALLCVLVCGVLILSVLSNRRE